MSKHTYYITSVYRFYIDCSLGGPTSRHNLMVVFTPDWTPDEIEEFVASKKTWEREQCLILDECCGTYRALMAFPRSSKEGYYCASGNKVEGDGRWHDEVCPYAISVLDRFETWELADLLSR